LQAVENEARQLGQSPDQVINCILHEALGEKNAEGAFKFRWVTVKGEALPDVDLDDRDALYERMEGRS
jgi:hypothetical protein